MKHDKLLYLLLFFIMTPVFGQNQPAQDAKNEQEEPPVTDDEFRLPVDERTGAEIDRLIPLLGSPDYHQREEATETLLSIGATAFDKLRIAYRDSDELEVQLRIEKIVHQSYRTHHVFAKTGFLGIQMRPSFPGHDKDPRIPEGHYGIELALVQPNTGAERAGFQPGDIIIALEGKPIEGVQRQVFNFFSAHIRKLGPGGQLHVTVLREDQTLEITATLGPVPKERYQSVTGVRELVRKADKRFTIWWSQYFMDDRTDSSYSP